MSASKVSSGKLTSASKISSQHSQILGVAEDEDGTKPDFIYGGPFITVEKPSPFIGTSTPINLQLQGTFKKSYAYYSLKEKLPVILTKVIDYCSREGGKIKSTTRASDEELRNFMQCVTKLKNDLVTNKTYDLFTLDTPECKKWNEWIQGQTNTHYFNNTWMFTECYVYRKMREACEINTNLITFDPFEEQKTHSFVSTLEIMCIVAEKVVTMLPPSEKDKRKQDFITLLKLCLWSNKCDLVLTSGSAIELKGGMLDPLQMIIDSKDKLLVDDTGKAADQIVTKAENLAKAIEGNTTLKIQCSCNRLATLAGVPIQKEPPAAAPPGSPTKGATPAEPAEPAKPAGPAKPAEPAKPAKPAEPAKPADAAEAEEPPKIPCPSKMTIPQSVMFDIVCDNAGYELFCDLCLAHFLVSQKIVQKVRFHVKNMPWFVSDVTQKDFHYVIQSCKGASFNKSIPAEPKPEPKDGSEPPEPDPPRVITEGPLQELATQWQQYLDDGIFLVMTDPFWTYPFGFKDMKKYNPNLYRKLQFAVAILFKGDLNYRKLLNDMNLPSTTTFDNALQGFNPAPMIAARTVKTELICGMPKGKADLLNKADEKWMQTGDYGVIHFSAKAEALKIGDRPCLDYGEVCFGTVCSVHTDL